MTCLVVMHQMPFLDERETDSRREGEGGMKLLPERGRESVLTDRERSSGYGVMKMINCQMNRGGFFFNILIEFIISSTVCF